MFSEQNAVDMAKAGADIVVCHLGLTTGGAIGAETAVKLKDCVPLIDAWAAAARSVNRDVIVLCHGGPIARPADARYILKQLPAVPRLLRRLQHGAAADGGGADRDDPQVQADPPVRRQRRP